MPKAVDLPLNSAVLPMGLRVGVAVSGGADSTALLLALHERSVALGLGLSVVHVNHGMRGVSAIADRDFVSALSARLALPLHEVCVDVPGAASADRETLEEAARHARLAYFARLLADGTLDCVATAHTADDQAETVMMKLIRGAWTDGLGGIAPSLSIDGEGRPCSAEAAVGRVVRPLLPSTREQVLAFLKSRKQDWREDETNADTAFTRNRVRAELMPVLRALNPRVAQALSTTAELAREEEEHWTPLVARAYADLAVAGRPVRGGGRAVSTAPNAQTVSFDLLRLKSLELPLRRRLLRLTASRMGVALTGAETLRILQMAGLAPATSLPDPTVPTRSNSRLQLRDSLVAERSVRELRLTQE